MRVRNRMELISADNPERQMLADNLLRAILQGRLPGADLEKICAADFTAERFCILDIDGSTVGTVSLRPQTGAPGIWEIRSLAVAKSWQRGGLAQFMFDKTLTAAREHGARRLRATLHSALNEAAEFFAKNEFRPEDPAFIAPAVEENPEWEIPAGLYTIARNI